MLHLGKVRSRLWAVTATQRSSARGHRTSATKRAWEGRGVCWALWDPACHSSFADCLLELAAQMEGDFCICSALILVQTWAWASHPDQLGRWGRHGYKPQQPWVKGKKLVLRWHSSVFAKFSSISSLDLKCCPGLFHWRGGIQEKEKQRWWCVGRISQVNAHNWILLVPSGEVSLISQLSLSIYPHGISIFLWILLHPSMHVDSWAPHCRPHGPTACSSTWHKSSCWHQSQVHLHEDCISDGKRRSSAHTVQLWIWFWIPISWECLNQAFLWDLLHLACEIREYLVQYKLH